MPRNKEKKLEPADERNQKVDEFFEKDLPALLARIEKLEKKAK